ncbi:hypothetical protein D5086_031236 [Populus alba]|uniref:Uncharacterized protein n=1 Tax=Populus alba TaxID=43335 RepID=A0ACC4AQS2_POPAL
MIEGDALSMKSVSKTRKNIVEGNGMCPVGFRWVSGDGTAGEWRNGGFEAIEELLLRSEGDKRRQRQKEEVKMEVTVQL